MNDEVVGTAPEETPASEAGIAEISSDEKTMAILAHVLGIVSMFVGPLIIWLIKKDESKFVDHHGKEALNFQILITGLYILGTILTTVIIGFCIYPIAAIAAIVFGIMAAVAANKGEWYKYPVSIRFIK